MIRQNDEWADGPKKSLTPKEVLTTAHAALISGVHQHHLAAMTGVNEGRVAEAVVALRWAAENHRVIYKHIQKLKGNGRHRKEKTDDTPLLLSN